MEHDGWLIRKIPDYAKLRPWLGQIVIVNDLSGRRRLTAPMYEVRCTRYDCDVRALCARVRSKCERDVLEP